MVKNLVTGRETLASLEQALADIRLEEGRVKAELEEANRAKSDLIAKRLEAFRELAGFRTRLALVDGVIDEADQLSTQVKSLLQARLKTISDLEAREKAAEANRAALIETLKTRAAKIEELEKRLDGLAEHARASLQADPVYRQQKERVAALESMAAKAAAKAEKAAAEEEEKGKPYRGDPLFMYLWERRFGTSAYEATGIIRWLDEWVARLIGYADARANFTMLTELPKRLAEHASRLSAERSAEGEKLEAMESKRIEELAGDNLPGALLQARMDLARENADLERINSELIETGNQLRLYAEGLDQSFRRAIELTVSFVESQSLQRLLEEARQTPEPGDERIVEMIAHLAAEVGGIEQRMKDKQKRLDELFARKQELMRIAADFRRARYDEPGSVFEPAAGVGMDRLLEELLKGIITGAEYWARTKSRQRWSRRPADSYRRTSSLPPIGRAPSPWSGGDFNTGGGF